MKSAALTLVCTAIATFAMACEEPIACTEIGCGDPFTLEFVPIEDEFQTGIYGVTVVFDDEEEECEFEVRAGCPEGGKCVVDNVCSAMFGETGGSFSRSDMPETVEFTITRGGLEVAAGTEMPEYETFRPNGPECEPVCEQAVVTVEVR